MGNPPETYPKGEHSSIQMLELTIRPSSNAFEFNALTLIQVDAKFEGLEPQINCVEGCGGLPTQQIKKEILF